MAKNTKEGRKNNRKHENKRGFNPIKSISNLCKKILDGALERREKAYKIIIVCLVAFIFGAIGLHMYGPAQELRVAHAKVSEVEYASAFGESEEYEKVRQTYREVVKEHVENGSVFVSNYAKTYRSESKGFLRIIDWLVLSIPFDALIISIFVGKKEFFKSLFSIPIILIFGLAYLIKSDKKAKSEGSIASELSTQN